MTIYVVLGQSGEYSDANQWCAKAFTDEAVAKAYVVRCTERGKELEAEHKRLSRELGSKRPKPRDSVDMEAWRLSCEAYDVAVKALKNEHDPKMQPNYMDIPGNVYWYEAIELETKPSLS